MVFLSFSQAAKKSNYPSTWEGKTLSQTFPSVRWTFPSQTSYSSAEWTTVPRWPRWSDFRPCLILRSQRHKFQMGISVFSLPICISMNLLDAVYCSAKHDWCLEACLERRMEMVNSSAVCRMLGLGGKGDFLFMLGFAFYLKASYYHGGPIRPQNHLHSR